jgi:glycosyltransferase involved in cell wall biosynthesis
MIENLPTIERAGIVIPAHNEEALLPSCLDAVGLAASLLPGLPVQVVVVLDRCDDDSRSIVARHAAFTVVEIDAGNVGMARAAGVEAIMTWAQQTPSDRIWLATTDADSVVPPDWLIGQVDLANAGWEVVVGTVDVVDWSDHPDEVAPRWSASYRPVERHPHVHGANLGCTAEAYLAAGGWPPLAVDEDVALLAALADRRIVRTATLPVVTSARRDPRAVGGFGDTLRALAG